MDESRTPTAVILDALQELSRHGLRVDNIHVSWIDVGTYDDPSRHIPQIDIKSSTNGIDIDDIDNIAAALIASLRSDVDISLRPPGNFELEGKGNGRQETWRPENQRELDRLRDFVGKLVDHAEWYWSAIELDPHGEARMDGERLYRYACRLLGRDPAQ